MKNKSKIMFLGVLTIFLTLAGAMASAGEPLPSWNDGPAKKAILDFVANVTAEGSPDFVPVGERIAVFDNDGTLWAEQPAYPQLFFAMDQIRKMAPERPEWNNNEPFASLIKGDYTGALADGQNAIVKIVTGVHGGMTTETFDRLATEWIATARHPKTGKLYTEMIYQPMLELLEYLRAHGFKNFIVSGGSTEFMRPWTEKTYGIPPEQVVGSSVKAQFDLKNGKAEIFLLPEVDFVNDGKGKPVGIYEHIGRRPIAAFGNSDGDLPMLEWTAAGKGARLCLFVHHTDAGREWAYDRHSSIGQLDRGLEEAAAKGWTVVDMKNDWKKVFPFEHTEPVIAIDILIEPDAAMIQHAQAANDRLLKQYPQGFALDETHHPHMTCIQRYVRTADLDNVYEAIGKVLAGEHPENWRLEAISFFYSPWEDVGIAGIVIKPTIELLRFQKRMIEAVAPFTVETGTRTAFFTTPEDPEINQPTMDYVQKYVPAGTGKKYNPHVSVGVAPEDYLDAMLKEKFETFTFTPAGVSVYQLGNFGAARKKLKSWQS